MIEVDFLKCLGQYLSLMHALAMLTILVAHLGLRRIILKYRHEIWSGPGIELLLHLVKVLHSSATEKGDHSVMETVGISWRILGFVGLFWAEL